MQYKIGPCPQCGAPAVVFSSYTTDGAKRAYAELQKTHGARFWCVDARPHPQAVKMPKAIWHIMTFGGGAHAGVR